MSTTKFEANQANNSGGAIGFLDVKYFSAIESEFLVNEALSGGNIHLVCLIGGCAGNL